MTGDKAPSQRQEERLRQQAAAWFARLRAPDGDQSRPDFDAWRAADPNHARVYDRLEGRWADSAVLGLSRPATRPALSRAPARRRRRSAWRLGGAVALPIAALLVVALSYGGLWSDVVWCTRPHVSTQVGEIRQVRLPDGSSAVLDTDTVLATHFTPAERRLRLIRGRARFEVASAPNRAFVIDAGQGTVITGGSLFDVLVTRDETIGAAALRGSLHVRRRQGAGWPASAGLSDALVSAGQTIALGPHAGSGPARAMSMSGGLWPQGLLDFRSAPLATVVEAANRYSRRKVLLAQPDLGSLEVSGAFRATDTADLAASLAAMFQLHLLRKPDGDFELSRQADS